MKAALSIFSFVFSSQCTVNHFERSLNNRGLRVCPMHRPYIHHSVNGSHESIRQQKSVITRRTKQKVNRASGINNVYLLRTLLWNQLFMLGIASFVVGFLYYFDENIKRDLQHNIFFQWSSETFPFYDTVEFPLKPLFLGLLGSIPSILMGVAIDRSDDHRFATANFSTVHLVMSLFGRRATSPEEGNVLEPSTKWTDVMIWSAIIATATGVSEEIIFRCLLPCLVDELLNNNSLVLFFVQATIFGMGHTSASVSCEENAIVGGFQFINGLCFGALYIFSGGNIIPCIVAHSIYDFQTLFFTWWSANEQIEYAYYKSQEALPKDEIMELKQLGTVEPNVIKEFIKLFYLFDSDRNGKISLSEAHKSIYFLAIDGAFEIPTKSEIDSLFFSCLTTTKEHDIDTKDTNHLRFPDFLRMLLLLRIR